MKKKRVYFEKIVLFIYTLFLLLFLFTYDIYFINYKYQVFLYSLIVTIKLKY